MLGIRNKMSCGSFKDVYKDVFIVYRNLWGLPDGSVVKNLPAMQEMRVQSLDWEDPLEKEMATHSSTLAWEMPWIEERGGLQPMGLQSVRHNLASNNNNNTLVYNGLLFSFRRERNTDMCYDRTGC